MNSYLRSCISFPLQSLRALHHAADPNSSRHVAQLALPSLTISLPLKVDWTLNVCYLRCFKLSRSTTSSKMVSTSPCEHPGNRLRTMELLDASIMSQYSSLFHLSLKSITDFVPYTYKDIKDVDLMEYSALRHFGMLPYITLMGRHCVPSDVFYWGIFNTDASDDKLLITGPDGRSNVIGWREVMTAFGGDHSAKDEFGGTNITRSQLLPYKPADSLPETVLDVSEELGSGKDSEEIIYYREAAPYGPTYYLMTLIAEVFWSNFRDNRFLMPMVYSYLRALHGNLCNWAKAILKSLSSEITFLQNEASIFRYPSDKVMQ
ncbi:hypothetical protein R1sor_019840 [Riccia sorocarpa]|uniref:Uncharacterized protein n=1 Tax=Riccia sorocarpa TaxID=122646 RepID=A0ABD3IDN1_9MARC